MEKSKLLELARQRLEYLKEWLNRYKQVQERVPDIQEMVERTEWEVNTIESSPEGADEFLPLIASDEYSKGNDFLLRSLPLPTSYLDIPVSSTTSITSSGTADVYSFVSGAAQIDDEIIRNWAQPRAIEYREIQENQSRYQQVLGWLNDIDSNLAQELSLAHTVYSATAADVGARVSAGIAMRNILEHTKGVLYLKAKGKSEQKVSWSTMAKRLTRGDAEYQEVMKQEDLWKSLHLRLTQVAKGQQTGLVDDLNDIWVKLVDHFFILSGLLNFETKEA